MSSPAALETWQMILSNMTDSIHVQVVFCIEAIIIEMVYIYFSVILTIWWVYFFLFPSSLPISHELITKTHAQISVTWDSSLISSFLKLGEEADSSKNSLQPKRKNIQKKTNWKIMKILIRRGKGCVYRYIWFQFYC